MTTLNTGVYRWHVVSCSGVCGALAPPLIIVCLLPSQVLHFLCGLLYAFWTFSFVSSGWPSGWATPLPARVHGACCGSWFVCSYSGERVYQCTGFLVVPLLSLAWLLSSCGFVRTSPGVAPRLFPLLGLVSLIFVSSCMPPSLSKVSGPSTSALFSWPSLSSTWLIAAPLPPWFPFRLL